MRKETTAMAVVQILHERISSTMAQLLPRIFLIAGSADTSSYVRASLDTLANILQEHGALPSLWDLSEQPLPPFNLSRHTEIGESEQLTVQHFMQLADQADAFVLGSPVYHNSFSGILKNALDTLSSNHFHHKPVALVSNGYSDRTASLPCEHLRSVVKGLSAIAIPIQLVTIPSDFLSRDGKYILADPSLLKRFLSLTKELLYFTHLLRNVELAQVSLL
jgi:azobenzene reductase